MIKKTLVRKWIFNPWGVSVSFKFNDKSLNSKKTQVDGRDTLY